MPNQYTNQPGAAVKLNQIRKANIQAIADDGGYTFAEAERIYESSSEFGSEGNVTIIGGDNACLLYTSPSPRDRG